MVGRTGGRCGETGRDGIMFFHRLLSRFERAHELEHVGHPVSLSSPSWLAVRAHWTVANESGSGSVTHQFLVSGFWNCGIPLSFREGLRISATPSCNTDFSPSMANPGAFREHALGLGLGMRAWEFV